jgi:hypothetical protein
VGILVEDKSNERGLAVYDVTARQFTLARPLTSPGITRARWLHEARRLLASTSGRLDVIEPDHKTSSTVLDLAELFLTEFALTPDERWLLVAYPRYEGDLWLREPQSDAARTGGP